MVAILTESTTSRVAVLQMNTGDSIEKNLNCAHTLLQKAHLSGAKLAVLPEMWLSFCQDDYAHIADHPAYLDQLKTWCKHYQLWLVAGAMPSTPENTLNGKEKRFSSACYVINDSGEVVVRYNKIHLFDAAVSDAQGQYCESEIFCPGDALCVVDTPVGKLGLAICYDLRFPVLFKELRKRGAELIALPSAFTKTTGLAHWEPLIRARAIEQQCYVLAANQAGWHDAERQTHGHSMIVDPWGEVLTCAGDELEHCAVADVCTKKLTHIRTSMPVHEHQRPFS